MRFRSIVRRGAPALAMLALAAAMGCRSNASGPGMPASVSLSVTNVTLAGIGATHTVVATVRDQQGTPIPGATVTWTSDHPAVASVDQAGVIMAVAFGKTQVRARAGTATGVVQVTVGETASSVAIHAGNGQTATVGTAVPIRPAVVVRNSEGQPLQGIPVSFTVSAGGGTITGGGAISDASGVAAVGSWTLGTTAGTNRLAASVAGLPPLSFTATGQAGAPAVLLKNAGDNQTAPSASILPVPPSVLVRDTHGNPVSGAGVTFAVTSGGGSVTGASATTNTQGIAAVGSWRLGPTVGANTLTATAQGTGIAGNPQQFTANAVSTAGYTIELRYLTSGGSGQAPTPAQQAAFSNAVQRWKSIITADLPDGIVQASAGACGVPSMPALDEIIDDLVIFVRLETIDGPGQVLGQAGPCFVREGSLLPAIGMMRFDVADLDQLENEGLLETVIMHEMGHVLGVISSIWSALDLLQNPSRPPGTAGDDTHFDGPQAIAAFDQLGGTTYTGAKVPVENTGNAGSADSHWRESVLARELMTPFVSLGSNPLSLITIRSLQDLGYEVDPSRAESFTVTANLAIEGATLPSVRLVDDVWSGPITVIDARGEVRATIRR